MEDLSARIRAFFGVQPPNLSENNMMGPNIPAATTSGEDYNSRVKTKDKEADEHFASEVRDIVSHLPLSTTTASPTPFTSLDQPKHSVPGPLDLSASLGNQDVGFASALERARPIEDLKVVPYPEGVWPDPGLNFAVTPRRFRYHREFLLKFMNVCKEIPRTAVPLAALEMLGLDVATSSTSIYRTGARRGGRGFGSMGMRPGSVGLGLGPDLPQNGFAMGNFQSPSSRLGDSQAQFEATTAQLGIPLSGPAGSQLAPTTRGANQGEVGVGAPHEGKRTRGQRGSNRDEMRSGPQASNQQIEGLHRSQQVGAHDLMERQVKALLNKLTMDNCDSISDQIIEWANQSEQEKDGSTLKQVIKLVFEKAKDNEKKSDLYALLCMKMLGRISPEVQDEMVRNSEGHLIRGGMLFGVYLLNSCQRDFERRWSAKETAPVAGISMNSRAAEEANDDAMVLSDKRQGVGLVRFIGELFKLQMFTEGIMHECIKQLLSNLSNPEEGQIESLCKLLTTVGQILDTPKARNHMKIYFERMQEIAEGNNINSRMKAMLLDVIELRARHWQARSVAPQQQPSNQSQDERGSTQRSQRLDTTQPEGWNAAPARAGDLSQFSKISKPTSLQFVPSSVFRKKDPKSDSALSSSSGATMSSSVGGLPAPAERLINGREPSMDLGFPRGLGGSGRADRNPNPVPAFNRSPQISRPPLTGTQSGSGGPRPAGSPRMSGAVPLHHQQHPGQPEYSLQQQWGAPYNSLQGNYDPHMFRQRQQHPHQQHLHQHLTSQTHTPPIQYSLRTLSAEPRSPPILAAPSTSSPHPRPSIIQNSQATAPQSVESPSLSVNAPVFVPGTKPGRRPIRISTPNGDAITFGPPVAQVRAVPQIQAIPRVPQEVNGVRVVAVTRAGVPVRMETKQQKNMRLAGEQKQRERKQAEREENERAEREEREIGLGGRYWGRVGH